MNGLFIEFQPDIVTIQPMQLSAILVPVLEILFAIAIALSFIGAIIEGAKAVWEAIKHGE